MRARRAIVAIPPTLAGRIAYDPPLPARRDQLTQRMPQGTVIKTMAIYERPFWREQGLSGQATSDAGPARVVFDNSPPDGTPGVLLGFLEGRLARQWGARPAAERRAAILAGHARLFGDRAAWPQRFLERVWAEEEWARGCYGCLMTTGGWTEYGRSLRAAIGPLHWAVPRPRRSGAATWTAPSSPANAPPRKCSQTSITVRPLTPERAWKS